MTSPPTRSGNEHVSRARYERERRARAEAEALLETKSRELFDTNRRLAQEAEAARAALAETEALRSSEALALKERSILSEALAALSGKTGAAEAMQALLDCLKNQFEIFDASFLQASGNKVRISASITAAHTGLALPIAVDMLLQPRRLKTLTDSSKNVLLPGRVGDFRAVILAPLSIPGEGAGAILLGCLSENRFSDRDLQLLVRICEIASQALIALREARRNALLVELIEGRRAPKTEGGVLDAPLEAVHRAFARLTDMQGQVVSILDALLEAPLSEADNAINTALERIAQLTGTDRAFVLRNSADNAFINCSHEWAVSGRIRLSTHLPGLPIGKLTAWRADFDVGKEVLISNIERLAETDPAKDILKAIASTSLLAVPMMKDGQFQGVLGFDTVGQARGFLPGEVHLVRSIAKVIVSVLSRRDAEMKLMSSVEDVAQARSTLVAAVEALQDGFVLFDADDKMVICNERYREIYRHSAPAIVPGARFEDILRYGLDREEYEDAKGREDDWLAERLANHRRSNNAIEQQLSDGRWLRIFEKATPEGGRVGLRVDITELKLAEARALADRSAAMEASQDGIAITDADGNFLYMNEAHRKMFSYDTDAEVIGKPWSMLYTPDVARWMENIAFPALQRDGRWSGDVIGQARDGAPVDQDVSLTLQDGGGLLCIVRDMRERRREAIERERLRDELQLAQRREIIGQMAAGLAHDFNNLLAAISGSAALIESDVRPGSPADIGGKRILAASDQAAGLVKRLLTLGTRQTNRQSIDLRQHMRDAAELVRAAIRAPTRLIVELPETSVDVNADPTDLLQVVLNLGINARDALDGQEGDITLSLTSAEPDDLTGPFVIGDVDMTRRWLCLTVADTGPGIDPGTASQVFKPYFSTKGTEGTGLGLAIVASIVTANGGAVRLDSQPGKGTAFRVLWPAEDLTESRVADTPFDLTGRLDGRSVLVVDDQEDVLAVLVSFLEQAGAEVAPSIEPSDVLEALQEDPKSWDLLVTDFDMPAMSGADLAQRARDLVPDLPVILVTALAGVAGRSGQVFDSVLGKPLQREALVSAAETAILLRKTKG